MNLEVLFEDDYCIVVNKPNNVLTHYSYYSRNIKTDILVDILKVQFGFELYPVHRLDRKTSGVILLAKNKKYISEFQELFTSQNIVKKYIAIVRGIVSNKTTIDSPVKNPDTKVYKNALTICKSISSIELNIAVHPYNSSRYSLIELTPKTGRMHQLRIHMNKISHPIVGDYKYGDRFHNRNFENNFDCHNMFLHAYLLKFKHPFTAEELIIKASLPLDWKKIITEFKWKFDV
ncbi:pseudouridine synthase [Lutibacter sp. TH_r2]|uniref:pseudouridine synthase n=1 Tax=Lutibacter sp. TH_r2 TaxID=3082083 RepID=UPI002954A768|nr:pseudouridine synthase [Lutibacter sp. TH_r2]MDV7188293.1 pseudouridine synthase [Lutibacter sp. TH_r2]